MLLAFYLPTLLMAIGLCSIKTYRNQFVESILHSFLWLRPYDMVHIISFYVIDQYKGVPIPEYHDIGTAFTPMSGYSKRYLPVKRSYQSCHFHANNHFVSNRSRFEPFQLGLNHCFIRYYFVI